MNELTRTQSASALVVPERPQRLGHFEERRFGRSLVRMERGAELRALQADLAGEVGRCKVQAVASVGNAAMTAQALVSARQQQLVDTAPTCAFAIAHIGNQVTLALGALVDNTLFEVTK